MIERIQNYLEILVTRLMIWLIRKGYGANCETSDLDDFPDEEGPRCGSCRAREIITWLEEHIENIKY